MEKSTIKQWRGSNIPSFGTEWEYLSAEEKLEIIAQYPLATGLEKWFWFIEKEHSFELPTSSI